MSLRSTFRPAELQELRRRLNRVPADEPDRWLDDFPEFWLLRGARWHRQTDGAAWTAWAEIDGRRCEHLFEPLRAEPGAWSYLCASFLYRALRPEAGELGATWLEQAPAAPLLRAIRRPQDIPADWRPNVIEDNTRVCVRWYLAQGFELFECEDLYRSEGFEFAATRRFLARTTDC